MHGGAADRSGLISCGDEVIEVNGLKYHERWSHLSKIVVSAFVSYLYTGIVDMELLTPEDIIAAKYFANNYPMLKSWSLFFEIQSSIPPMTRMKRGEREG